MIFNDILGLILLSFCFTGEQMEFKGNLCYTMSWLKPGMSWYDQAKMSW